MSRKGRDIALPNESGRVDPRLSAPKKSLNPYKNIANFAREGTKRLQERPVSRRR